jgi:endonuclease/exonuclease/phosphatase family metal-dependent hydrolase
VKYIDRIILLLNLAVIAMTFMAYFAPNMNPSYTWIFSFFGLMFPIFVVFNFLFIVYWLFRKWTRSWLSSATLIMGYNAVQGFIGFNTPHDQEDMESIQVMNYNISNGLFGYTKDKEEKKLKKDAFEAYLSEYDDVAVKLFQEVGDYAYEIIKETYPKHHIHYIQKGAIIVSRYPIIKKGEIDFGTKTNSCVWADIKLPDDTVRFYSYHLQSNQISRDAEKLSNQTELDQNQAWYDIKGMLRKYKNKHIKRSKQVDKIVDHAIQAPHPVILGGDLNDPPQSYTYQAINKLGADAFRLRGSGIGTTYNGVIPLLRIDYLFVDSSINIADCKIIKNEYSDHFPVLTTLAFE